MNASTTPASSPSPAVAFTVLIPAYNYAHYLPRALDSVYQQTLPPDRIVVVDDGSTDETPAVLERYQAAAPATPQLLVLRQHNQGPSTARNHGIRHAIGDYIVFLDADDALLPDALHQLASAITAFERPAMVFGGRYAVSEDGRRVARPAYVLSGNRTHDFAAYVDGRFRISNGTAAVARHVFERISYPEDLRNNEDMVVDAQILANHACRSITTPIAEIHAHPGRLRNAVSGRLDNALDITNRIFDPANMPAELMRYRSAFLAGRYLSRFRSFYRTHDHARALTNYMAALRTRPLQALKLTYLTKALASAAYRSIDRTHHPS